jgi:hypothetical protein
MGRIVSLLDEGPPASPVPDDDALELPVGNALDVLVPEVPVAVFGDDPLDPGPTATPPEPPEPVVIEVSPQPTRSRVTVVIATQARRRIVTTA